MCQSKGSLASKDYFLIEFSSQFLYFIKNVKSYIPWLHKMLLCCAGPCPRPGSWAWVTVFRIVQVMTDEDGRLCDCAQFCVLKGEYSHGVAEMKCRINRLWVARCWSEFRHATGVCFMILHQRMLGQKCVLVHQDGLLRKDPQKWLLW